MSYVRVTASLRDSIIASALAKRFAGERLAISEQEEIVASLNKERDKAGYEAAFSDADRKRLQSAPSGWFPEAHAVKVAVEGTNEVIEIKFDTPQRVPYDVYDSRYITHIASIISADHPYMLARTEAKEAKEALYSKQNALHEQERQLRAKVKAVVESVTTVSRLIETWPEAQELLPEVHAGPSGGLPAGLINDLNDEIGLKKAA
jgi:hypothetical protein